MPPCGAFERGGGGEIRRRLVFYQDARVTSKTDALAASLSSESIDTGIVVVVRRYVTFARDSRLNRI